MAFDAPPALAPIQEEQAQLIARLRTAIPRICSSPVHGTWQAAFQRARRTRELMTGQTYSEETRAADRPGLSRISMLIWAEVGRSELRQRGSLGPVVYPANSTFGLQTIVELAESQTPDITRTHRQPLPRGFTIPGAGPADPAVVKEVAPAPAQSNPFKTFQTRAQELVSGISEVITQLVSPPAKHGAVGVSA